MDRECLDQLDSLSFTIQKISGAIKSPVVDVAQLVELKETLEMCAVAVDKIIDLHTKYHTK